MKKEEKTSKIKKKKEEKYKLVDAERLKKSRTNNIFNSRSYIPSIISPFHNKCCLFTSNTNIICFILILHLLLLHWRRIKEKNGIYTIWIRSITNSYWSNIYISKNNLMEKREYLIILYDFYSELLSDKQKEHFEDYYFNNLSLGEISENENVSRNAIHKSIKSIENKLYFYEEKLKLYQKSQELNTLLANIKDEKLKKDIKNIL